MKTRERSIIERRWLRRGGCVACGRPRGYTDRRASWHQRGQDRRRKSKRFCPRHLRLNRIYQARTRRTA